MSQVGDPPGPVHPASPALPLRLDQPTGTAAAARHAATVLVLRDPPAGPGAPREPEIFCVMRHASSSFLGGAIVFPGGKVDDADFALAADEPPGAAATGRPSARVLAMVDDEAMGRAVLVAACRETLEEAGILPARVGAQAALAVRRDAESGGRFADVLRVHGAALDLGSLVPFARWVTPTVEPRRFDARFFLLACPDGQEATADGKETTLGFWATPRAVLQRFGRGEVQLAPPTTRCLELLSTVATVAEAFALAERQSLMPICPCFVPGDPPALALPGDPAHEIREARVEGPSRFVLRDGRFVSEDP